MPEETTGTPAPNTPPAATSPAETPKPDQSPNTPPAETEQDPAWMAKRLERAQREAVSNLLAELGVSDVNALKDVFGQGKALIEGQKSELQRVQEQLAILTSDRDGWKTKYETLVEKRRTDVLNNALRDAIGTRTSHPDDVIAWIERNEPDELAELIGGGGEDSDDFKVNETGAKTLVTKCAKARPEWFKADGAGVPANAGASVPANAGDAEKLAKQAKSTLKKFM
jgi:hypothetical protein